MAKKHKRPLSPKPPRDEGVVLGRRSAGTLLRNSSTRIQEVLIANGANLPPELMAFLETPAFKGKTRYAPRENLDRVAGAENHQGIVVLVTPQPPSDLEHVIESSLGPSGSRLIVVLDQIVDPQNFGAIIRVCEAAGVGGVVSTIDRSAPLSPAARKASAGASEVLPVCFVKNLQQALEEMRSRGFWIYGTALGEKSASLYETEFTAPTAIVLGAEGKGLRALTQKLCDSLVSIPMSGVIESLNVSQAASVVLYELLRRRTASSTSKVGSRVSSSS